MDTKNQYYPIIEPFLKNNLKIRVDKCIGK